MVWYSHLLKNFPQFIVIHTVKGFDIFNKAEVDAFLEPSCFFDDPEDIKKRWQEYTEELYKKIFTTQIITMV